MFEKAKNNSQGLSTLHQTMLAIESARSQRSAKLPPFLSLSLSINIYIYIYPRTQTVTELVHQHVGSEKFKAQGRMFNRNVKAGVTNDLEIDLGISTSSVFTAPYCNAYIFS